VFAQVSAATSLEAVTSKEKPPETGSFNDLLSPTWQHALRISAFEDFTTRKRPSEATEAYLIFGPDTVYCAFVSHQSSASITANQTVNSVGLGLDDYVGLMFDTSGNGTNQYFFEATPGGVRYQQASESTRYNPTWTAFARIGDDQWLAEFAIPYRFLRGSGQQWRVNFVRWLARPQQTYTFAYDPQMTSPYTESWWPAIRHVPRIASRVARPTAEIYGLTSVGGDSRLFEGAAGQFAVSHTRALGIDAKIPLSAGVNFDGTLNPDYSSVENDQQVISPQEFRYQYSEYRPFFTQGANYLPGNEIFYSPSVGVFDHGEKIEGQVGHFGIGFLNVGAYGSADRAYALSYNAPNQETSISVYGAQADRLAQTDTVAELALNNINLASQVSYGVGRALESGTMTSAVGEASRSYAYVGVAKPNYSIQGAYYDIGPDYHPTDAYVPQSDIKGPSLSGSLSSTPSDDSFIRSATAAASVDRYLDGSGAVREADSNISSTLTLHNLLAFTLAQSLSSLRLYQLAFPSYVGGLTLPYDQATAAISLRAGTPNTESVSYSWGPFGAFYLQQFNASITHQLSRRYSVEFDYSDVRERAFSSTSDGQSLQRLTLYGSLSRDESLSIAYRAIEGAGGYAVPRTNLAFGYLRRFKNGSTLQAEAGSPAAPRTLQRYILKYVLLVGSGSGE
jgi:hypothetical protein